MPPAEPLHDIPAWLIAGPLGAGKTSLLRALLAQRPAGEQWAILINEFGQLGVDAALLGPQAEGVQLAEIPGGCICCVNGLPLQVGLTRLLRRARPQRLFIELSGLGHPQPLLKQLTQPPWDKVLRLQPLLMVVDGPALLSGQPLPESQQDVLPQAGLLLINKAETLDPAQRRQLQQRLPALPALFCSHSQIALGQLPDSPAQTTSRSPTALPLILPAVQTQPASDWQQLSSAESLAWRIAAGHCFSQARLNDWLGSSGWLRAKAVVHTDQGWQSLNALPGSGLPWQPLAAREDSRIELLGGDLRGHAEQLDASLRKALISQ